MEIHCRSVVLAFAVLAFSAPALHAIDALLLADTFTRPDVIVPKGRAATLRADGEAVIYLKFGFDTVLPEGTTAAQISKATLRLYDRTPLMVSIPEVKPGIGVVPVLGPWHEHSVTAANAPATGAPVKLFEFFGKNGGFVDVDMTALVREWISGTRANNGLALRGARGTDAPEQMFPWVPSHLTIDSKENTGTSHEPRLQIVLLPAPQPN